MPASHNAGVFTQGPALTKEGTACCLSLLATSAAADEMWQEQPQQYGMGQVEGGGIHQREFVHLDCSNVRQMEEVLLSAVELAKKALTGAKFGSTDAAQALKVRRSS